MTIKTQVKIVESIELADFSKPFDKPMVHHEFFEYQPSSPLKFKCSIIPWSFKSSVSQQSLFKKDSDGYLYDGTPQAIRTAVTPSKNSGTLTPREYNRSFSCPLNQCHTLPRATRGNIKNNKNVQRSNSFQQGKTVRVVLKSLPELSHTSKYYRSQLEGRLGIQEEENKELSIDRNSDPNLEAKVKETTKELNEEKRRSARRKE